MWDVFHSDRLEVERSLTTEAVRAALARGDLGPDDLIRPAGTTPWTRLADMPAPTSPPPRAAPPPPPAHPPAAGPPPPPQARPQTRPPPRPAAATPARGAHDRRR